MAIPVQPESSRLGNVSISKTLTCEEIVELVLLSINAHYQRDADKIELLLTELKNMDQQELVQMFQGLRGQTPLKEAVSILSNWIEAKIDKSSF